MKTFHLLLLIETVYITAGLMHTRLPGTLPKKASAKGTDVSLDSAGTPDETTIASKKKALLKLLQCVDPSEDCVLADPMSKNALLISSKSSVLGGDMASVTRYELSANSETSSPTIYTGSSDTYFDLLMQADNISDMSGRNGSSSTSSTATKNFVQTITPFIPPPLRSRFANIGREDSEYVPMRDLFTSPVVSYAYERGWRQGFGAAGFPGPEQEAQMAMEYFEPAISMSADRVLVDMSCATGLFTRRFAKSKKYKRVLGCDYSSSMLQEARRRIQADPELKRMPELQLVRLDVSQIPMQSGSVDALHAGAAMHCWPDLPGAAREIYRVLRPNGGRYFATTFLSSYFGSLQQAEGGAMGPSQQAFQYFESVEQLRALLISGGFEREKVAIEVLGNACVVIRCEK